MSSTSVSIHQPNFMPWLKLLDKILASDVYIAYDTVQYTKTEFHARQKIKHEGGPVWLSVPLRSPGQTALREVLIDNDQPFRSRQLRRIKLTYGRSPYFDEVYPILERVYRGNQDRLVDLNVDLIEELSRYLGSAVRIIRASEVAHEGDSTERLVQLVRAVGGDTHLTSTYGTQRRYVDWSAFRAATIRVLAQGFDHPTYPQPVGEFVPNLAAIDMLFACGRATADILAARRSFLTVAEADVPVRDAPVGVV